MDESCDRHLKVTKSWNIAAGVVDLPASETGNENYIKGSILSSSKHPYTKNFFKPFLSERLGPSRKLYAKFQCNPFSSFGGTVMNPLLSWISCGPRITTVINDDGSKRTGWTFGWALGDPTYKVVCVEELCINPVSCPILLVACEGEVSGSCLCFYHSGLSRVLKAIRFNEKITSIAVVSKSNCVEENLSTILKPWNGVVAVGTATGKVYLVDVWWKGLEKCMEDCRLRVYDEQRQSKLIEVSIQDLVNNIDCRTNSVYHGSSTLALWLNEETLQRGRSATHPGVQNILGRTPREFLTVSALKYFPQITTLAVGYNTSCFQLWDLSTLTILYTSALLEAMLPVFSFSLLEPSDDPRFVCYLWSLHHSEDEDNIPFAGMYILSYHEKHLNHFNSQPFYEGFSSCSIRYQLDLGADIDNALGGRIISCQSIRRSNSKSSPLCLHTESEEGASEEHIPSLLVIVWEVWTPDQLKVYSKLTLFDLNQWYREYMPQSSDTEYSHFMSHLCLPEGPLLDVKVIPHLIRQFNTMALQPVDEHFYPSATSFECLCLQPTQILSCSHAGVQEECLCALIESGPSALLQPARLYKMFTQAGIKPLLVDVGSPSMLHSKEHREYLLSVALEFGMTQFLRNCVRDWSDGSHAVAGCTLPSLLSWAWGRVQKYKKWLDRLCVPLFDFLGTALDNNDLDIFQHMIHQLHSLFDLFKLVLEKYHNYILQDNFEQQHMAISLVKAFYHAVLWCVKNNLLPETNAEIASNNAHIHYYTEKIVNATISRRAELHHLAKSLKHPVPPSGLFLIDAVIAQEADGNKLTDQWEREGGSVTVGKYPPSSIQSLLRTYLIRGIPAHVKHFIVGYFLHDIVHCCHSLSEKTKQNLLKYPSDFGLSESQCKIIQAFWCLDHRKFEEGVDLLLDSNVNKEDLQVYQHRTVISLLLASGKHKLALHYINIRRPGLMDSQDIKMEMTLLLINNLIHQAFEFQRHHHSTDPDLLEQFFTGCVEMNKLDIVFKLPLHKTEEEGFMTFLEKTSHPQADDLRVLYLLSRSRYVEAIDINEKLRGVAGGRRGADNKLPLGHSPLGPRTRNLFGSKDLKTGVPAGTVLTTRDLLINSVAKNLPSVTRDLAHFCSNEKHFTWKQVSRPTPLSVIVHTELSQERLPFYKAPESQLVQAALSKTRETWAPLLATPAALKRKLCSKVEDTPFLRTAILPNSTATNLFHPNEVRSGIQWRTDGNGIANAAKKAKLELSPYAKKEVNNTFNKTMDMDITCPESSALLLTPLVQRVVKPHAKESTTPHSILKGRSAANTPVTPGNSEKSYVSSGVNRQIRFSLPQESSSSSSPSVVNEEEDHYSPSVTPRKSIHEPSGIQGRTGTPANPRILRTSFRSVISQLKFDDEESTETEEVRLEPSATAASLLRKISKSPVSSEETYFSFQSSSSSRGTRSRESGSSFRLSLGLEGNIMAPPENEMDTSEQEDLTLTENQEVGELDPVEVISNIVKTQVNTKKSATSQAEVIKLPKGLSKSYVEVVENLETAVVNQPTQVVKENLTYETVNPVGNIPEPKSPDEVKIVVELSGTSTFKNKSVLVDNDLTMESFSESESLLETDSDFREDSETNSENIDAEIKKPIFKWTTDQSGKDKESLKLEVKRQDHTGKEQCVAKVTISEVIPMYYSESKDTKKELDQEVVHPKDIETFPTKETECEHSEISPVIRDAKAVDVTEVPKSSEVNITTNLEFLPSVKDKTPPLGREIKPAESKVQEKLVSSQNVSPFDETPLPQILEEILKRGRISLSVTEKQFKSHKKELNFEKNEASVVPTIESNKKSDKTFTKSKDDEKVTNKTVVVQDVSQANNDSTSVPCTDSTDKESVKHLIEPSGVAVLVEASQEILDIDNQKSNVPSDYVIEIDTKLMTNTELQEHCGPLLGQSVSTDQGIGSVESCDLNSDETPPVDSTVMLEAVPETEISILSDISKDDESDGLTFVIESVKSVTETVFDNYAVESISDFELKMSEGDSTMEVSVCRSIDKEVVVEEDVVEEDVVEEDVVEEAVVDEEPLFHTLTPLEVEVEEDILDQELNDEPLEGEQDEDSVDVYGDIEEVNIEEEDIEEAEGRSSPYEYAEEDSSLEGSQGEEESVAEDKSSDVICLSSNSDDEPSPEKKTKRKPQLDKSTELYNETLDYEDDYEGSVQESEDSYSESGEENLNDESLNEDDKSMKKTPCSDSSESGEEGSHHRNRSWKSQKKSLDSNESLEKDDFTTEEETTIESPPYELIGQDSISDDNADKKLETIVEVTEEITETTSESGTSKFTPSSYHVSSISVHNVESTTTLHENKVDNDFISVKVNENVAIEYKAQSEELDAVPTEETKIHETADTTDLVKLALDARKKCVETGSILDLKKKRSKRYSSASDLSLEKSRKLRRRSSSLHDFTSALIMERKSVMITSAVEKEAPSVAFVMPKANQVLSAVSSTSKTNFEPPLEVAKESAVSQTTTSELDTSNMSSKASSLIVEIGSVASTQQSISSDLNIFTTGKLLDYPRRKSRSITSRSSSLQDISEDISEGIGSVRNVAAINSPLRRSLSANQLAEHGHNDKTLPRRSSSVSRWCDYAKAHESEMISEICDKNPNLENISLPSSSNEVAENSLNQALLADDSNSINVVDSIVKEDSGSTITSHTAEDPQENEKNTSNKTCVTESYNTEESMQQNETVSTQDQEDSEIHKLKRRQRACSEPSTSQKKSISKMSTRRRSSSMMKIQDIHSRVFARYSLNRRSLRESIFEPLEIMQSDEESFTEPISTGCDEENREEVTSAELVDSVKDNTHKESQDSKVEYVDQDTHVAETSDIYQHPETRRKQRGYSEPPRLENVDIPKLSLRRRSTSSSKIPKTHKLIFSRYSHRKSTLESNFQPLEIIQSDEEKSFHSTSLDSPTGGESIPKTQEDKNITTDDDRDIEKLLSSHVVKKKRGRKPKIQHLSQLEDSTEKANVDTITSETSQVEANSLKTMDTNKESDLEKVGTPNIVKKKYAKKSTLKGSVTANPDIQTSASTETKLLKENEVTDGKEFPESSEQKHVTIDSPHVTPKKRGRLPKIQHISQLEDNTEEANVDTITSETGHVEAYSINKESELEKVGTPNIVKKKYAKKSTLKGSVTEANPDIQTSASTETKLLKENEVTDGKEFPESSEQKHVTIDSSHVTPKKRGRLPKIQHISQLEDNTEEANVDTITSETSHVEAYSINKESELEKVGTPNIVKKKYAKKSTLKGSVTVANPDIQTSASTETKLLKENEVTDDKEFPESSKQKHVTIDSSHVTPKKPGRPKSKQYNFNKTNLQPKSQLTEASDTETEFKGDQTMKYSEMKDNAVVSNVLEYPQPPKKRVKKMYELQQNKNLSCENSQSQFKNVINQELNIEKELLEPDFSKHNQSSSTQSSKKQELHTKSTLTEPSHQVETILKKSKSNKRKPKAAEESKEDEGRNLTTDTTGFQLKTQKTKNKETDSKKRKTMKESGSTDKLPLPEKSKKHKKQSKDEEGINLNEKSNVVCLASNIDSENEEATRIKIMEHNLSLLDSPARRTRRSMSRLSETELATPTKSVENTRKTKSKRRTTMSDIGMPTSTKHAYAESEASDASTSSRLNTPTRRSTRRMSFSATSSTPDLIPEEYLAQRRLTRNQHSQLQKSFEKSLMESPIMSRLEDLPEESGETEDLIEKSDNLTPVRSSSRNSNRPPSYSAKKIKSTKK